MSAYYSLPVNIRQTAATAANSTVWAMRNSTTATIVVVFERIELLLGFDSATPASRATPMYDMRRFSSATPTGGTALTVAQAYSGDIPTQIIDARFLDTGLTTTGCVFNPPFVIVGCPASDGATTGYERVGVPFLLGPGEGLCIRLNTVAIIGQSLTGEIVWNER